MKKVVVEKMGQKIQCRPTEGVKWKCGSCLQGLVLPHLGEKCKICRAIVVEVHG